MDSSSQNKSILEALRRGEGLTHKDAEARFECTRLAARIKDIKEGKADGRRYSDDELVTLMEKTNGKRYARYRLYSPAVRAIMETPAKLPEAYLHTKGPCLACNGTCQVCVAREETNDRLL